MRAWVVWLLLAGSAAAQGVISGGVSGLPQAPRDPAARPATGTAVIRGRVTAADSGMPIRRGTVTLGGAQRPRSAYTDHEGRYQFTALPAGTYTVFANGGNHRAAYQAASYGSTASNPRGRPLQVANGQQLEDIDIALPRTGAITGRVTDATGDPVARVQVSVLAMRRASQPMQSGGASTDDLGQFRVFGLPPGEYLVLAESRMAGGGPMEVEGEALGFARTYAPGTPRRDDALRVRVGRGGDAVADIRLIESRVFTVSGTVLNSKGEPLRNSSVSLAHPDNTLGGMFGAGVGQNGTFVIRNVPPGQYDLSARYSPPRSPEAPMTPGPPAGFEMAVVRIDVAMADLENVTLVTSPGESFTGEITFEEGAPENRRAQLSVIPVERRSFQAPARVQIAGDKFTATGLFGPVLLRGSAGTPMAGRGAPPPPPGAAAPGGWFLKAVLLDGKDITDVPTSFTSAHSGRVQVVFTSQAPALEGSVTDDAGRPTRDATVVVFSHDEAHWVPSSSRIRLTSIPRDDGKFALRGLREGRYYAAAVTTEIPITTMTPDREFFEALRKVATDVILNPGEIRTVELRVVTRVE